MSMRYTVDESVDPEVAANALRNLRRMIRYGRMAERAMASLQEKGFYEGLTPLACSPRDMRYGDKDELTEGKKKSRVKFARLPMRLPISRADLAPMGDLKLEFIQTKNTSYAGNDCKEIPLVLVGTMVQQTASGLAQYATVEDCRHRMGSIRVNKNHLSWLEESAYGNGAAHRVYKETKYPGAQASLEAFAKAVSRVLVTVAKTHDGKDFFSPLVCCAKTLELQLNAWEWFLADGHAERMFRDIHEQVRVIEVMES